MNFLPGWFPGGATKAFPLVVGTPAIFNTEGAAEAHTIPLPSGIAAGERLLIFFNGSGVNQTTSGWTKIIENTGTGAGDLCVFSKIASGSEGASVSVSVQSGSSVNVAAITYRVSGAGDIEGTAGSLATSVPPNPPSHAASWGADKNLWFAVGAASRAGTTTMLSTSGPSGYGNNQEAQTPQAIPSARHLMCASELAYEATDTQDPGAFTLAATPTNSVGGTIVIRPT